MNIEQAKTLASALTIAIAQAEANGSSQVALQYHLQQLDDQARAELQAAIDAATK